MKKTILFTLLFSILGCQQSDQKIEKNDRYVSQPLNTACESFLTKNISDYIICDSWKVNADDMSDIIKNSQPYLKNFVSTHHLLAPIEINIRRVLFSNGTYFLLYPNGFFVKYTEKFENNEWYNSEVNQSYICIKKECQQYFLWDFVDERIIEENGDYINSPKFRGIYQNILDTDLKSKVNNQADFIFKNDKVSINGSSCHYKDSENMNPECLYLIVKHILYIYKALLHKYVSI